MLLVVSAIHLLISISVGSMAATLLLKGRQSFLAITILGFIVLDSLGLSFAPYIQGRLPFGSLNAISLMDDISLELYARQVLAHWILFLLTGIGLIIEMTWPKVKGTSPKISRRTSVWIVCAVFIISMLGYVRFFVHGSGMQLLASTKLIYSSPSEAVYARVQKKYAVQQGQGQYLASLASNIGFPLVALFALQRQKVSGSITTVLCALLSLSFAVTTRQKAPVVGTILTYCFLAILHRWSSGKGVARKTVGLAIAIVFLGLTAGAIAYTVNFGLPFSESLRSTVIRLFLVPARSETNFFAVFPEAYQFRGIEKICAIDLGHWYSTDVTIYDVAIASTGDRYSANASFLAVAWSGLGYLGVGLAALILVSLMVVIDFRFRHVDRRTYLGGVALSLTSILTLVSGGLSNFVGSGGFLIPIAILIAYRPAGRRKSCVQSDYQVRTTASGQAPTEGVELHGSKWA